MPPTPPSPDVAGLARAFAAYGSSPQGREAAGVRGRYGLVIDGRERAAREGGTSEVREPATGEVLAEVAEAGPADVDDAVRAARRAWDEVWRDMPGRRRARLLFRLARLLGDRARECAVREGVDAGVPIRRAGAVDVPLAAAHLFHHAGWADKLEYAVPGMRARPRGVAALLLSSDAPLLGAARALAPALACGDAVVLKPAASTPLSALLLAEVVQEAGIPPGVVNVVTGAGDAGAALVAHADVDVVALSGSARVVRAVRAAAAGRAVRLAAEVTGPHVHLVFGDAALDQALEGVVEGAFVDPGRGARLLVQESVADEVLDGLRRRVGLLRVGDPLDANTDVGPMGSEARLAGLRRSVEGARADGCEVHPPEAPLPGRGWFHPPVVVHAVGGAERIAREVRPGPVLTVRTFRTEAEAVASAAALPDAPHVCVWSGTGARVLWVARGLGAGVVWANASPRSDPAVPAGAPGPGGARGGRQGLAAYLDLTPVAP